MDKSLVEAKKVFDATEVLPPERWDSLIEDCKDIMTEHVTEARETVIKMKWCIGDRLLEEGENVIRPLLQRVAKEVHLGERDLYYCLEFRKKFTRLEDLWEQAPEGKNISWHKLVNNYIDFTIPKPEIPVEEHKDEFGIFEWWDKHPDLHILRLTNKDFPFSLIIKTDKAVQISDKYENLKGVYKEIGEYFVKLKRWEPKDLNRNDYARMNKAIKELLEKASYDKEKVKKAISWCQSQYGVKLEWSMETVVKKFAEAVRPVEEYEKYLKKPKHGY